MINEDNMYNNNNNNNVKRTKIDKKQKIRRKIFKIT